MGWIRRIMQLKKAEKAVFERLEWTQVCDTQTPRSKSADNSARESGESVLSTFGVTEAHDMPKTPRSKQESRAIHSHKKPRGLREDRRDSPPDRRKPLVIPPAP
uniref:Uncharacterized protein n=1 Tax=Mycena chlorophos TaxID=658473 RepID=A0ABQ0LGZ8_MYCCL|nr:predicted protein [Mycena chlorophos]